LLFANFGLKRDISNYLNVVWLFGFEVPVRASGENRRNSNPPH
jgi:hypothetical protein